ncbi:MAG: FTR1 family protein [Variibacter sp.]|nr:FTR1 family protein [Variibacter sp.]
MTAIFFQAGFILLREGLEALLVIAALAAYLRKAEAHHRLRALYGGAAAAIAASLAAAWAFAKFNDGMHNDLIEGVTILCAAALMLYVSGWLLLRQDPRGWQSYLKSRADEALSRQTGLAVALLAFLAVFREGAETVLFIHTLAQTSGGFSIGLIGGLIAAALALCVLFVLINNLAQRLPLRPLFLVTSAFLFLTAVKFVGDAIQEFQEQQMVPYTELKWGGWLSSLGLNPTLEAVALQLVVVALALTTFLVLTLRARRASAEAATPAPAPR